MLWTGLTLSLGCRTDTDADSATAADKDPEGDPESDPDGESVSAACAEAARLETEDCATVNCAEADPLTCTYGEISVDGDDCGCFTTWRLYEALCEAGVSDDPATLEAGIVCAP
jgi:hypothetical protein